ncbi:MAG: HEAT repeat domain-containing protein [Anaerolineae bacterium]|nr:HEAT repeat domain-containing protein [Anaerolineae bacterium]
MDSRIEDLINALREGDVPAQRRAVQTLAHAGAEIVEPVIAALEQRDDPLVRRGAAFASAHLRDPRLVPLLMTVLDETSDTELRVYAAQALAMQRDARAIEPLIALLRPPESGELPDDQAAICEEAVRALGELGDAVDSPRIIEALAEALNHPDWGTRQSAAEMLIRLEWSGWERAETSLLADLTNDDVERRLGAAASLVELADGRALEPLVELLNHPDRRVASNAALILGKLGDQRAIVPLSAALSHASDSVREAARKALRQLHA